MFPQKKKNKKPWSIVFFFWAWYISDQKLTVCHHEEYGFTHQRTEYKWTEKFINGQSRKSYNAMENKEGYA